MKYDDNNETSYSEARCLRKASVLNWSTSNFPVLTFNTPELVQMRASSNI
jgi:hypothetical protein